MYLFLFLVAYNFFSYAMEQTSIRCPDGKIQTILYSKPTPLHLVSECLIDGGIKRIQYNPLNNSTKLIRPDGAKTTFQITEIKNVKSVKFAQDDNDCWIVTLFERNNSTDSICLYKDSESGDCSLVAPTTSYSGHTCVNTQLLKTRGLALQEHHLNGTVRVTEDLFQDLLFLEALTQEGEERLNKIRTIYTAKPLAIMPYMHYFLKTYETVKEVAPNNSWFSRLLNWK